MRNRATLPILEFATLLVVIVGCVIAVVPGADEVALNMLAGNRQSHNLQIRSGSEPLQTRLLAANMKDSRKNSTGPGQLVKGFASTNSEPELIKEYHAEIAVGSPDIEIRQEIADSGNSTDAPELELDPLAEAVVVDESQLSEPLRIADVQDIEPIRNIRTANDYEAGFADTTTPKDSVDLELDEFLAEVESELGMGSEAGPFTDDSPLPPTEESVTQISEPETELLAVGMDLADDEKPTTLVTDVAVVSGDLQQLANENETGLNPMPLVRVGQRTVLKNVAPGQVTSELPSSNSRAADASGSETEKPKQRNLKLGNNHTNGWKTNPTLNNSAGKESDAGTLQKQAGESWFRVQNEYLEFPTISPTTQTPNRPKPSGFVPTQIRNEHFDLGWKMLKLPAYGTTNNAEDLPAVPKTSANPNENLDAGQQPQRQPMSASSMQRPNDFRGNR